MKYESQPTRVLRDYQLAAIAAVRREWSRGIIRTVVVHATGLGKTDIIAKLATDEVIAGGRVLLLAHRSEPLDQMTNRCSMHAPQITVGRVQAERNEVAHRIIVASVQTLCHDNRMVQLHKPTMVIIDEAHHGMAASYIKILSWAGSFETTRTLGVTATLVRGDGRGFGELFETVADSKGIDWAVRHRWLVPPRGKAVLLRNLDLAGMTVRHGDYADSELGPVIDASSEAIVKAWMNNAGDRITVAFTPTIASAQALCAGFTAQGVPAEVVIGSTAKDDRKAIYARLAAGQTRVLVSVMVTTEAWDSPAVSCVLMARPTALPGLYCFDAATEVLTPTGWRLGREVRTGDIVSAFDPTTGNVQWETVQASVERPLYADEHMVSLTSPTADLRVTNTHRMVYSTNKTNWRITTAGKLSSKKDAWYLPVAGQEKFAGAPLTDEEIALIGWVQTDGCINKANNVLTISQQSPSNCFLIEKSLNACGLKWRVSIDNTPTNYGPRKYPLHTYRVSKGMPRSEDTHLQGWNYLASWIPKANGNEWNPLDQLDNEQWLLLLLVMHLANGQKQLHQSWTRRSYHISTPNKVMADWIQAGCMRRGWRCNISAQENIYIIHCSESNRRVIGGANQYDRPHLERSDSASDEQVWCISVPSGAILTRRNGKGSIMGNCQMVGRGLRLADGKTDCLVLDVVGVSRGQKLVTLVNMVPSALYDDSEIRPRRRRTAVVRPRIVQRVRDWLFSGHSPRNYQNTKDWR